MTKLGFVQPNFRTGPKHLNAYYLPYTLGLLWCYARTNQVVRENFTDHVWVYKRDDISFNVDRLKDCSIVLFSVYVWNKNYCYKLAKELKKINPTVRCVFGGPEVPFSRKDFFIKHPYIDHVIVGEGENEFLNFLLGSLTKNTQEKIIRADRIKDLDIPSPYLEGTFNKLMQDNPDIEWMPTLETDRGCPYKCTFCDWGSLTASKITKFGLHRVFAELDWVAEKQLPFLTLTNANFGIFKERDLQIADKIVEIKKNHNVPTGISVSYAKNSNADVFEIIKRLDTAGIQSGFVLSLQSDTEEVLESVKRTNMGINDIEEISGYATELQIPLLTELILGLPGESKDTFENSMFTCIEKGINNFDIFLLLMIENAPIQSDIEKYKLKTFTAYDQFYETSQEEKEDIVEGIEVIKSTNTMSKTDLLDSYIFAWYMIGLHSSGIADIIAKYLHKSGIEDYQNFYTKLIDHLQIYQTIPSWEKKLRRHFNAWTKTGFYNFKVKGLDRPFPSWQVLHTFMMLAQHEKVLEEIIREVAFFVKYTYNLQEEIVSDYIALTINRIKTWENYKTEQEIILNFTNLWHFVSDKEEKIAIKGKALKFRDRYNHFPDQFDHHLDNIVFGRRRNWILNVIDIV